MDKLENFITTNRAGLDRLEPSPESWPNIEKGLRRKKLLKITAYSSAAFVTLITGLFILFISGQRRENSKGIVNQAYQQELKESEIFYNTLYNNIYNQARPLLMSRPDADREIRESTAKLDSICADLKKDLKDNVANREVIESLIRNYRIKIQLLEEMLEAVKQNDTEYKEKSHEL